MQPFSACTLGTLAPKAARSSSRRPGLAVMTATTRIICILAVLRAALGRRWQITSPARPSLAKSCAPAVELSARHPFLASPPPAPYRSAAYLLFAQAAHGSPDRKLSPISRRGPAARAGRL